MRLDRPRIIPLEDSDANERQAALLAPFVAQQADYNIFRTMVRHPEALERFLGWGNYILSRDNSLSPRVRELAILRTGYNCRAGYEWAQHVVIGRREGLDDDEIVRIKAGPMAAGWSDADRAVLAACDDLTSDFFVSEATWAALKQQFNETECMDLVFTVGQYTQVSMLLNSFGVQLDPGLARDEELSSNR